MAGIVASTLRRKAFHRGGRGSDQTKFVTTGTSAAAMSTETVISGAAAAGGLGGVLGPTTAGHAASYSPSAGGSRLSSRSSSFVFRSAELDDQQQQQHRPGTGAGSLHGHTGIQVRIICSQIAELHQLLRIYYIGVNGKLIHVFNVTESPTCAL